MECPGYGQKYEEYNQKNEPYKCSSSSYDDDYDYDDDDNCCDYIKCPRCGGTDCSEHERRKTLDFFCPDCGYQWSERNPDYDG